MNIDAVNRQEGYALSSDGEVMPITHWFDSAGEEVDDRYQAVAAVVKGAHKHFAIDLRGFSGVSFH